MAFLMLIVLYAIVFQLWFTSNADLRVTDNDVSLTRMDLAIESALQEVYERLRSDVQAGAGADSAAAAAASAASGGLDGGAGETGGGESSQPVDSREDAWGKPQRTTINEIELRVFVQDEDSKVNVLGLLTPDEEQAELHLERIVRVIDMFRDGSTVDVDRSDAIRIAESIRDYLRDRAGTDLPRPRLLSDDAERDELSMPLSFGELVALDRCDESLFRDFRDEHGYIVHSLGSYLTVWTSVRQDTGGADSAGGTGSAGADGSGGASGSDASGGSGSGGDGSDAGGSGGDAGGGGGATGPGSAPSAGGANFGVAVNVNTAPVAVLKSLVDDRDVPSRFWDEVVEYRNLEEPDEAEKEGEEALPVYDEYGNEVYKRQVFDSLDELSEVDGYENLDSRAKLALAQLLSTQSQVFSIYVVARRATGSGEDFRALGSVPEGEREDLRGKGLVRAVRSVVWRVEDGDEVRIVPLVRWEVLDYVPFDVLDYPDEDR
jgi:hypothetical protein